MGIKSFFQGLFKEEPIVRASKGTVKDGVYSARFVQSKDSSANPPKENLNLLLNLYQDDPVIQSALSTRADAILASGYTVEGAKSSKEVAERVLKKVGFSYPFLLQVVTNLLVYDHCFIEIERTKGGAPAALHVLEATFMEIQHDPHGEIIGYIQRGESGQVVHFPVDDVVFMRSNVVSSSVWGESGITSLYNTITTKTEIESFINQLARSKAWRQIIKTRMSEEDVTAMMPIISRKSASPVVMMVRGDGSDDVDKDTKFSLMRDPSDLKEFLSTLDYLRTQVLMRLKTPPIMIGLPDSSNRSNSDMQYRSFNIANASLREIISFYFIELFDKLGIGTSNFSWNPLDERDLKSFVEIAERLINMGADHEVVEEFLRTNGLELSDKKLFKEPELLETVTGKSMDMYPSRKGKDEGESNKKIGSGEEGSTRKDQLEK